MESEIERYRGALKQESSRAHEVAPISALYEDCLQYFQQLCNIAEASQADKERVVKVAKEHVERELMRHDRQADDERAANIANENAEEELLRQASQVSRARYLIVDDCFSKFRDWGSNTGASSRSLDHALRKSSELQQTTKELLKDLFSTLSHSKSIDFLVPTFLSMQIACIWFLVCIFAMLYFSFFSIVIYVKAFV